MIQLYAKRGDLKYSEQADPELQENKNLLRDLLKHGIKDSINIRPDGYILRGNTRTHLAPLFNNKTERIIKCCRINKWSGRLPDHLRRQSAVF